MLTLVSASEVTPHSKPISTCCKVWKYTSVVTECSFSLLMVVKSESKFQLAKKRGQKNNEHSGRWMERSGEEQLTGDRWTKSRLLIITGEEQWYMVSRNACPPRREPLKIERETWANLCTLTNLTRQTLGISSRQMKWCCCFLCVTLTILLVDRQQADVVMPRELC